jgi:DNA repair exonuclease SbcCD ATPase subunit
MGLQGEFGGKYYSEATIVNTLEAEKMFRHRYNDIQMGNIEMIKTDLIEKKSHYRENFKNEFALKILKFCNDAMMELKRLNKELSETGYDTQYVFDVHFKDDSSDYASIIRFGKTLSEGLLTFTSGNVNIEELDQEMDQIVDDIINSDDIDDYADYRNYLSYDILFSNDTIKQGSLSKQIGSNSGAELQIPYTLILISALLMIYNHRDNSSRILFIDEPFEKLSPDNVMKMVRFFKEKKLQCFFCSASNLGDIGQEADVILQAIKYGKDNSMKLLPYHFK